MRAALADQVELTFEIITPDPVGGGNEQLLHMRLRLSRGGADIGTIGIDRQFTPAQELLALLGDDLLDDLLAARARAFIHRQKHVTGGVPALFRQFHTEVLFCNPAQKFIRQAGQDAGAVTGVGFTAAAAAVYHALQDMVSIEHDLVTGFTLDMSHETDATTVLLLRRIVKTLFFRQPVANLLFQCGAHTYTHNYLYSPCNRLIQ